MKLFSKKASKLPSNDPEDIESFASSPVATLAPEEDLPFDPDEKTGNVFYRLSRKNDDGPKKRLSKKGKIILIVCIAVALLVCAKHFLSGRSVAAADVTYTAAIAQKRDISVTLSGSGTLEAASSYNVTSLVSGEVKSANFEKGDTVKAGDVLYQIDSSDAQDSIKSAQINVEKAELSYQNAQKALTNLTVVSPAAGTVTTLNVKVGDNVQNGSAIGVVRNSGTMSLKVPFNSADVNSFYIGESARVTLESTFETLSGTITKISSTEQVLTGNMLVKYVTIDVTNPGGITDSTYGTATVGDIACNGSAAFTYKSSENITAKASGTVKTIVADEGDRVAAGGAVIVLSNDDAQEAVTNAKLNLEEARNNLQSRQDALEDYTIKSPIDGTVIEKNVKAGDKLSNGSVAGSTSSSSGSSGSVSSNAMCTIYDLSYLTMDIRVDELDVSKVKVGQKVSITADAVEGKTYEGEVTSVSLSGTTSNGVTAYPVTVKITETEGLLPGMNVDAKIVVESVSNVLTVPVDAVARGNKVLVQSDTAAAYKDGDKLPVDDKNSPVGFKNIEVTLGLSNDDYIEIKSGLKEGEVIAVATVIQISPDNSDAFGMGGPPDNGDMPQDGEDDDMSAGGGGMGGGPQGG
ncbi:MAG: HlyD family efflux transporter periplasmic adaptor subunit [Oscillospiraceae bacterium]|jgi:HlyD family secretion protein